MGKLLSMDGTVTQMNDLVQELENDGWMDSELAPLKDSIRLIEEYILEIEHMDVHSTMEGDFPEMAGAYVCIVSIVINGIPSKPHYSIVEWNGENWEVDYGKMIEYWSYLPRALDDLGCQMRIEE